MELLLCGAAATGLVGYFIYRHLHSKELVYNDPPDTVILCQFARGPAAPSMAPFALKLETFLRMLKIDYKSVTDRGVSPKEKVPYIMFNGEKISDSQLSIEFIKKKYNIDPYKNLSAEEKAVATAFRRMVDESTYWGLVVFRWCHHFDKSYLQMSFADAVAFYVWWLERRNLTQQTVAQGLGRHTEKEVTEIIVGDLEAISSYLGNKPFMMGKEPTEVDCAIFGMLAQFRWHCPGSPYEKAITETYPNLDAYLLRMKERFWSDWDECIHHNGTRTPSK